MIQKEQILKRITQKVHKTEPTAQIFLYGSYARGDYNKDSDIDILILLDKKVITFDDEVKIKYPLYDIEIETGFIISPLVLSRIDWKSRHRTTPFYSNIQREGVKI